MQNDFGLAANVTVAEGLKQAAICHTSHVGLAASALLGAAADILCASFGPEQTSQIIVDVVVEAVAQHIGVTSPAGHA